MQRQEGYFVNFIVEQAVEFKGKGKNPAAG